MLPVAAKQIRLLERLCNAMGVSGAEGEVRRIVLEEVKPFADEVRVDALGNVLATKRGRGKSLPRLLLDAHMDEVGFMIVEDEGDGVYRFETIGGIDERYLAGKQVIVGSAHTPAVIGVKPIHLILEDDIRINPDTLRFDLGPGGKASIGDHAVFATKFARVRSAIFAKSIDNRIGVATLIELIKNAPATINLYAVFSVQAEIGLRGVQVAAQYCDPDLAIAIDATPARDLPDFNGRENIAYNTKLGRGPAIDLASSSTMNDARLVQFLQETAIREKIPYQFCQPGGGATNAGAIQGTNRGVPVVSISVPHRYTRSPISLARLDDWKNTLNLLYAALPRVTRSLIAYH